MIWYIKQYAWHLCLIYQTYAKGWLSRIISGEISDTFGVVRAVETEAIGDIVDGEDVPPGVVSNPAAVLY